MAEISVPIALFLVERVLSSLEHQVSLGNRARNEVRDVANNLRRMKAYLRDMEGYQGSEVLKIRVLEIRDIAYDTEDVLDEIMLHVTLRSYSHKISKKAYEFFHTFTRRIPLHEVYSKMEEIKRRIDRVIDLDPLVGGRSLTISAEEGPSSSSCPAAEHHHLGDDYEIVGFEKQTEKLIRQLKGAEEPRRKTISLVGPCGSGKSTLTKNVYNITRGQGLFDCYAWVHVSASPKFEEILFSMFKQFCASRNEPIPREDKDTKAQLRNYLQQKRYLLFLDDIWSIKDWEYFQNALPNNGSRGSRIVITTRNSDVAQFCSESSHMIHHVEGLSYPEAWSLFCKKAFQAKKCPRELQEWSEKILKKCELNPLAIVAVGTLLSKKQQIPAEWKRMHDNLVSEIGTDSSLSIINKLLASYKDLPGYLKPCFLYFSMFPEDYAVERGRLVRLWIAERFVMRTPGHETREQVAEDYLNQLVRRNLVHVETKEIDGRVRDCRVLNFVLEFIIQKSEEENFVSVLAEAETSSTSSEKVRRLSLNNNNASITSPRRDFSSVRSVFYFKAANLSDPSEITGILRSSKLLRVLDLRDAPLNEFPEGIFRLTLLRYLSLRRTNIRNVPKDIKYLPCLETLDLKETYVTELPKNINLLHNLRHLLVYHRDTVQGVEMVEGIGALSNLQKLTLVKLDKNRKIIEELGALTQLRKLGLTKLEREDGKNLCKSIQKMENLLTLDVSSTGKEECLDLDDMDRPPLHLQRLYLEGRLEKLPGWISSLDNLYRIGLKWSRLKSSPLGLLDKLPNLRELEMVDAFTGEELVFQAGSFKNLKTLKIEQFDRLHTVVVEDRVAVEELGAMPLLQKLTLHDCVNLKLLPLGINNLTRLEELLLYDMPSEFTRRVQRSSEEHEMVSHIRHIRSYVRGGNGSWSVDPNVS